MCSSVIWYRRSCSAGGLEEMICRGPPWQVRLRALPGAAFRAPVATPAGHEAQGRQGAVPRERRDGTKGLGVRQGRVNLHSRNNSSAHEVPSPDPGLRRSLHRWMGFRAVQTWCRGPWFSGDLVVLGYGWTR